MFVDFAPLRAAAACLGCEEAQLTKALCTQNIKAGLDWIAKPNTTTYSQNVKDALSKVPRAKPDIPALSKFAPTLCQALYSRLFDVLVDAINTSLMFGGSSRFFIGAVDIFGFECFPHNSLEQVRPSVSQFRPSWLDFILIPLRICGLSQLCINFANEKLQRMFTEAVFESILAEYRKEGIDVRSFCLESRPLASPSTHSRH